MSSEEWLLLAAAVLPVILTILLYWLGVKIARRSEERQRELDRERLRDGR